MVMLIRARRHFPLLVVLTTALVTVPPATGELTAAQCVIIYNSRSAASKDIAGYYAMNRRVPEEHLLGIDLPLIETISRVQYESAVRPVVRRFLTTHDWGPNTRCLITCYDVPLRIGKRHADPQELQRAEVLETRLRDTFDALAGLVDRIRMTDTVSTDESSREDAKRAGPPDSVLDRPALGQLFNSYLQEQARLAVRHDGLTAMQLTDARAKSFKYIQLAEGSAGVLRRVPGEDQDVSPNFALRVRAMREKITSTEGRISELITYASPPLQFDEGISMLREVRGLFGVAAALQKRVASLRSADSASSFDSELALVLWDKYDPDGWQLNDLHHKRQKDSTKGADPTGGRRTLMVARLDAPTPGIVRRMIATAIDVEKRGLKGVFYIDARSVKGHGEPLHFDHDLIELARLVRTETEMPVVLNLKPGLFQRGDCPNAALYCGWYSLAKYIDAFDFIPGAVAVHIASFELISLRERKKAYWCKELLKDGATATFGATSEPYLQSFPLPTEFFGRLLTGRYTLVEAYSQTKFYNSWRLSLLGDPLYNPFKNNPQLPINWKAGHE